MAKTYVFLDCETCDKLIVNTLHPCFFKIVFL